MRTFDITKIFEQLPSDVFSAPTVFSNQRGRFESDDLFRQLSRQCEIRYVGYKDRPLSKRRTIFINEFQRGTADIAFLPSGINFQLSFNSSGIKGNYYDFNMERGKVHFRSSLIMNGVCVAFKGWIDLDRLDGVGCLEYDHERGAIEDSRARRKSNSNNSRFNSIENGFNISSFYRR